jgi:hypothetical protein
LRKGAEWDGPTVISMSAFYLSRDGWAGVGIKRDADSSLPG